jgi:predicted nucleic acid-binding protein
VLLLDTSFLVEYEAELVSDTLGPARRLLRSVPFEPVAISVITLGEFAEGFANIHQVEAFLSRFRMIPLSRSIAYKTAAMQAHLPQQLGENDAWIAATALAYHAELAGRESAFTRVPRLKYIAI